MNGFIITLSKGYSLDRNFHWMPRSPVESYVFSSEETERILEVAKKESWHLMPKFITPATYADDKVYLTGKPRPAYPEE